MANNPYLAEMRGTDRTARRALVAHYSYAVPCEDAIQAITRAAHGRIIEIGAGGGYWAAMLHEYGADVIAYDDYSWEIESNWFPVERGGVERAAEDPSRALFLCWPPYEDPMALDTVRAYAAAGGKTLAFVGEDRYGCTATESFFEWLDENAELVESVAIPTWDGIHDDLTIWKIK